MSQVEVTEQVSTVEITEARATVTVEDQHAVLVVTEPTAETVETGVVGPQGPPGAQGIQGPPGPPGFAYVHDQQVASALWTVAHSLGGFPNVTVVDSAGTVGEGDVTYVDANTLHIAFGSPFSGKAYLS